MMKKARISQPMAGKSEEEIRETRERIAAALEEMGYEVVNTLFEDEWYSPQEDDGKGHKKHTAVSFGKELAGNEQM